MKCFEAPVPDWPPTVPQPLSVAVDVWTQPVEQFVDAVVSTVAVVYLR